MNKDIRGFIIALRVFLFLPRVIQYGTVVSHLSIEVEGKMDETCMFCLESVKSNEQAMNPIGCTCHFISHGTCLQGWFEQKQQYECPICHAVCVVNPVQVPVVVYVETARDSGQTTIAQQRCVAACCLGLLFWALFVTILDYVLRS